MLPLNTSLDEVKVRIRESYSNPNVGKIEQVVLKDGPRAFRIATLLEILDPNTGKLHHYSLKIDSIDLRKRKGWFAKPKKSVRLEGDNPNEIERLYRFLTALNEGRLSSKTGDIRIIGADDYKKLEKLLEALPSLASSDKVELVKAVLPYIEGPNSYIKDFVSAFQGSHPETVRHIAVASRMVGYRKAYDRLVELVEDPSTSEPDLQKQLEENPWIFGSEYSQLLDRRTWTRDEELDFMLRRTVDDFLEIVEIKRAFKEPLLLHDKSHDAYYPSSQLSVALGQAMGYIEEIERNRDSIVSKDGYDTLKIRARLIIGRNGSMDVQRGLRNLNAHLHRIEVITFDQLLRIGERVLNVFENESRKAEPSYEPFVDEGKVPF